MSTMTRSQAMFPESSGAPAPAGSDTLRTLPIVVLVSQALAQDHGLRPGYHTVLVPRDELLRVAYRAEAREYAYALSAMAQKQFSPEDATRIRMGLAPTTPPLVGHVRVLGAPWSLLVRRESAPDRRAVYDLMHPGHVNEWRLDAGKRLVMDELAMPPDAFSGPELLEDPAGAVMHAIDLRLHAIEEKEHVVRTRFEQAHRAAVQEGEALAAEAWRLLLAAGAAGAAGLVRDGRVHIPYGYDPANRQHRQLVGAALDLVKPAAAPAGEEQG